MPICGNSILTLGVNIGHFRTYYGSSLLGRGQYELSNSEPAIKVVKDRPLH